MIPILLAGLGLLGAGSLLFGCAETQKARPKSPGSGNPPEPKLGFSEAENALAYRLYQRLRAKGVPASAINRGYYQVNYAEKFCPDSKSPACILGKADNQIQPAEVLDYCLEEEASCGPLLEAELKRPLPWKLDDGDPTTNFDAQIRQRVADDIRFLEGLIEKQGFKKSSTAYQERLAVGLYALVAVIPDAKRIPSIRKHFEQATQELKDLGLQEYQAHLEKKGGLRVEGDLTRELSALEALKTGQGECTEHSKILYAVLKMAGLKPFFVFVNPWKTEDPQMQEFLRENPTYYHVCIGLEIAGKTRLLDSAIMQSRPLHRDHVRLSLRDYLAADLTNHGGHQKQAGQIDRSIEELNLALQLSPQYPLALINLGATYATKNQLALAQTYFETAREMAPHSEMVHLALGLAYKQKGDDIQAFMAFQKIIAMNPNFGPAFSEIGLLFLKAEKWVQAEQAFKRAVEIDGKNPAFFAALGFVQLNLKPNRNAVDSFTKAIELQTAAKKPVPPDWYFQRGNGHFMMKSWEACLADYATTLKIDPGFAPAFLNRGLVRAQRNDFAGAREDFLTFFKSNQEMPSDMPEKILFVLAPEFEKAWERGPAAKLRAVIEAETEFDVTKAQSRMAVSRMLWETSRRAAALALLRHFTDLAQKKAAQIHFSPPTQKFFRELRRSLPPDMQKNEEVQKMWEGIL